MKNSILTIFILANGYYLVSYVFNYSVFLQSIIWLVTFIVSLCISAFLFLRLSRHTREKPYLSLVLLCLSVASLGFYALNYFIANLLG
jgi:hypothetical protein